MPTFVETNIKHLKIDYAFPHRSYRSRTRHHYRDFDLNTTGDGLNSIRLYWCRIH